jgi:hypothetical protein
MVQILEDRLAPATITVNTTTDALGIDSLREAITSINNGNDANAAITANRTGSYGTNDTIDFAGGLTGTISLGSALPDLMKNVSIDGPDAASLTIQRGAATPGFGIFAVNPSVKGFISDLTISRGYAFSYTGKGGGISNFGTLTVSNCVFSANYAAFFSCGGGIYNSGTLTVIGSIFSQNGGDLGTAGIANTGTLTVMSSTFSQGHSNESSGGIDNRGTMTINNSTFSNNYSSDGAAGMLNSGIMSITDSTFSNNLSSATAGGIYNDGGTGTISSSTFSGNSASGSPGGAIFNDGGPNIITTLTVTNSTFSSNSASLGGAIFCNPYTSLTLVDCTLSGNVGASGGGIFINGGTVTLRNTIVAGNTVQQGPFESDIAGAVTANFCLIQSGALFLGSSSNNITGISPMLAPLGNNGGNTQTMALLPGSPAIDAGSNALVPAGVTTDQRGAGFARIVDGKVDIGAFELQGIALVIASPASATFVAKMPSKFQVTATGFPAPTFSLIGAPAWLSINPTTGVMSGTPPHSRPRPYTFTIKASNGISPDALQQFTLTVTHRHGGNHDGDFDSDDLATLHAAKP